MKKLLQLYISFFRIGILTFGGGMAMLPMLNRELIENRHWIDEEKLTDLFAIGQCTPGIIAVNTATFVGYQEKGIIGGLVATLGIITPSVVIITLLAVFFSNFSDHPVVQNAFAGIRACVCVLIINSVIKLWKSAIVDRAAIIIFAVVFLLSVFTGISAVFLVLGAGVVGIAVSFLRKEAGK